MSPLMSTGSTSRQVAKQLTRQLDWLDEQANQLASSLRGHFYFWAADLNQNFDLENEKLSNYLSSSTSHRSGVARFGSAVRMSCWFAERV